jgi:adenine-specific DNA methylase
MSAQAIRVLAIMSVSDDFKSATHPRHYLMHKYWGRKAHNLLAEVIERNSKPGDVVLDPFLGSGVTLIEANKLGRRGIGYDLNPISKLITDVTLSGLRADKYANSVKALLDSLAPIAEELYQSNCPVCKKSAVITNSVWEGKTIVATKVRCEIDGLQRRRSNKLDKEKQLLAEEILRKLEDAGEIFVPRVEMFSFVRRSGLTHIHQLFSPRNLLVVSLIHSEIEKVKDKKLKSALFLTFTSMLPNVSKMIPGDIDQVTGKSGWQITKFWAPTIHTEKNVLESFRGRAKVIAEGLKEIEPLKTNAETRVNLASATKLKGLKDSSIDLVFADPPYGDSVSYLALSMFWNVWVNKKVDYDAEVIFDRSRKKDLADYERLLKASFAEVARVIKPQGTLVVTFNNRQARFWNALMSAIAGAGFQMTNVTWVDQAVRSGTQGLNRNNTLHGDFLYTFKLSAVKRDKREEPELVIRRAIKQLFSKQVSVTASEMYQSIIPKIISAQALNDNSGNATKIETLIELDCEYVHLEKEGTFAWVLRK